MEHQASANFSAGSGAGRGVGPVLTRFGGILRIAVLRGGGLGDLMFALPAVDALAAAYPDASITLLGTPVHRELLTGRPGSISTVEVLPFSEGVRPGQEDSAQKQEFMDRLRGSFDLAVQIHGGGRFSNPFLLQLKASHTVGTRTPDAEALERTLPYVYNQHEVFRALEVAGLAGAVPLTLEPRLQVTPEERADAAAWLDSGRAPWSAGSRPLVLLHPGATDPRRQWAASSFAAVASRAADDGCRVLVVGDDGDADTAAEIVRLADRPDVSSTAGALQLGQLLAVLEAATVMVGNDSGPRHLAQAVGTATVGVYWVGNVINAAPMGRMLHRVHMAWVTHCPVCGVDVTQVGWTAERCEHNASLVQAIRPEDVYADVVELMATSLLLRGR